MPIWEYLEVEKTSKGVPTKKTQPEEADSVTYGPTVYFDNEAPDFEETITSSGMTRTEARVEEAKQWVRGNIATYDMTDGTTVVGFPTSVSVKRQKGVAVEGNKVFDVDITVKRVDGPTVLG